jgi:hypothetical protein
MLRWGCLPEFCNEPIWLAHHPKRLKLWRLPKIKVYISKYRVPPLWPTYIGEKEDNICQTIWDKSEVLWRTCWGTHWEFKGNIMRTRWELGEMENKSSPPPPPKPKRQKKQHIVSWCLGLPIACMKFLFPKEFVNIFGLG